MMITDAQSDFARQKLIKAFYLPNGVLKEVARHLPETAKVAMPAVITKAEHAQGRTMLNHFLCQQKVGGELGVQAAKGIDLLQKRLDERDDLGHWNHIEPLQNIYASSLKGEVYQEPVVVPAQKMEAEVSGKQEVSSEKTETALDYKSAVVQGALAASVPVALNQVKQKAIPKPLPQADPVGGSPAPGEPEKPRSKGRARIEQAIAAGGPLAKTVIEQEAECGEETVEEALELLRTDRWKEIPQRGLEALRNLCRNLKKINSNLRWQTFKFDPANGGKVSLNTIDEAIAGVECEEQGLIEGVFSRSAHRGEEFIDKVGRAWDVKTGHSCALNGKRIFDVIDFVGRSVKKEYARDENVIINITNLVKEDIVALYRELANQLTSEELVRTIVVHAEDSTLSRVGLDIVNCKGL